MQSQGTGSAMPNRSRQQEIEQEGRDAFRAALPGKWVVRTIQPDYGIDDQVEIFNHEGKATGRTFLAQHKATDEPDLKQALSIRLKLTTVAYLAEQDVPVLVVLYHVPTNTLYARWFHAFDVRPKRFDQKTITYKLTEHDQWQEDTPSRLAAEVERWRSLRLGIVNYPISLVLRMESGIGELSAANVALALKAAATKLADLIAISSNEAGAEDIPVLVDDNVVHINAGGSPSFSLHHKTLQYSESDGERLVSDFFCCLGLWLAQIAQVHAASRLFSAFGATGSVLRDPEAAIRVAAVFIRANNLNGLIALIESLFELDGEAEILAEFLQTVLSFATIRKPEEASRVSDFLRDRARQAGESGDSRRARTAFYNYGSFLRTRGEYQDAAESYRQAAEWDPDYPKRDYYCAEYANCLFHLGDYTHAIDWCEKALALNRDPMTLALYADALMHAGRYEEARDGFVEHVETYEGETIPAFLLKLVLLNQIIESVGPHQGRKPDEAQTLAEGFNQADDPDEASELIRKTRDLDALNPWVHYNTAIALKKDGRLPEARDAMAFAGILTPGDLEIWTKAALLSLTANGSGDQGVANMMIFLAAYQAVGDQLIDALRLRFKDDDEMLAALSEWIEAMPRPSIDSPTIRFLSDGPEYETLEDGGDNSPTG